ncbi:TPA: Gfo/Idh/MocA family oxidoreductase [Candidatus Poribacteria bacterium]|nr:Gfo/Idh/MocA family oxidoreductase [Candidatus Poribacteria bacterium]
MAERINIGIVGCARIMPAHLRAYKILQEHGIDNFRITALCARQREDAERFRKRGEGPPPRQPVIPPETGDPLAAPHMYISDLHDDVEVEIYTDYREMIQKANIDAIDVYASLFVHHDAAIPALEAGKHVMVEKPFAISVKAGRLMLEAAEKNNCVLCVAENAHYNIGTRSIRWVIDQGYIGDIQMYVSGGVGGFWSPDKIVAQTPWRHQKVLGGGGGAIDHGVHQFNVIRYTCGEVEQISGLAKILEPMRYTRDAEGNIIAEVENDVEDVFMALLKFENGAVGQMLSSWGGHGESIGMGRGIYGSKGCIKGGQLILDDGSKNDVVELFNEKADQSLKDKFFPMEITDGFALETLSFLNAIEHGTPSETDGKEGLRDLAASFAILESSEINRPVTVDEVESGEVAEYQKEIDEYYGL